MTSFKYDQFAAFGSDSAGLERILRGLQALLMIATSGSPLTSLLLASLPAPDNLQETLLLLRGNLGLTRRTIRFFWFLKNFGASYNLYTSISSPRLPPTSLDPPSSSSSAPAHKLPNQPTPPPPPPPQTQTPPEFWLDVLKFTLLGLYGLLESATLPDLLGLGPGWRVFGPERAAALNVEAQRFWLLGLICAVLGNLARVPKAFAHAPVPRHGGGYGMGEGEGGEKSGHGGSGTIGEQATTTAAAAAAAAAAAGTADNQGEKEEVKFDLQAERARLKAIVTRRREHGRRWRRQVAGRVRVLGRKVVADSLDCVLPAAALGWVGAGPLAVGVVMFASTVLTGGEIWERCGVEVRARRGG